MVVGLEPFFNSIMSPMTSELVEWFLLRWFFKFVVFPPDTCLWQILHKPPVAFLIKKCQTELAFLNLGPTKKSRMISHYLLIFKSYLNKI